MARPAARQGDRQMAKGSCLDDKGRKDKMQEKTSALSSKRGGHPLLPVTSQLGRAPAAGQGGRGSIQARTPCRLPGDPLGWMPPGRMLETGCGVQAPVGASVCPKALDTSKQKTIQTLRRAGFPWQPLAPTPTPTPAAPHPFSSWTKLSIWSLWVQVG